MREVTQARPLVSWRKNRQRALMSLRVVSLHLLFQTFCPLHSFFSPRSIFFFTQAQYPEERWVRVPFSFLLSDTLVLFARLFMHAQFCSGRPASPSFSSAALGQKEAAAAQKQRADGGFFFLFSPVRLQDYIMRFPACTHTHMVADERGAPTHHAVFSLLTQTRFQHVCSDTTNTDVHRRCSDRLLPPNTLLAFTSLGQRHWSFSLP